MKKVLYIIFAIAFFSACGSQEDNREGIIIHEKAADGGLRILKTSFPDFAFTNQNGDSVTQEDFKNKIYVVDFFFTRCPSICVPMAIQMKRIYTKYEGNDRIRLLSHSIDTRNDSIPDLKEYEQKLSVAAPKWNFVTGSYEEITRMAKEYMVPANVDENAPGGYNHSGKFILIDRKGQMRGFCDGTSEETVDEFIKDIDELLDER